jgi:broad specificity phosphatase PhoE
VKEILKHHPSVEVIYDDRLKEMNFGKFQGGISEELYKAITSFKGVLLDFKPPGGESFRDLLKRAASFLKDLRKYKGKTILIVAHGRVIRSMVSILLGIPIAEIMKEKFHNTSVTTIELTKGKFQKIDYNCIKHLG